MFLGPSGLGPWQRPEFHAAVNRCARDEAFHVIPVLLPGSERPRRGDVAHLGFLIDAPWVEFIKSLDDERAFRELVSGITGIMAPGLDPTRSKESVRIAASRRSDPTTLSSSSAARA